MNKFMAFVLMILVLALVAGVANLVAVFTAPFLFQGSLLYKATAFLIYIISAVLLAIFCYNWCCTTVKKNIDGKEFTAVEKIGIHFFLVCEYFLVLISVIGGLK